MISAIKIKHFWKEIERIYSSIRRMDEVNYMYDGKFEGNILNVGRTGRGKTTFVQNLGKNKLFGETKEVYWISKIELSKDRERKLSGIVF